MGENEMFFFNFCCSPWFEFINKEDFEKDEKILKIKEREKRMSYVQEGNK